MVIMCPYKNLDSGFIFQHFCLLFIRRVWALRLGICETGA